MIKEYYVHANKGTSNACNTVINNFSRYPITSKVNGVSRPDLPKTTNWATEGRQMLTGEWATPRIPADLLSGFESQAAINTFLAAHGQDIRELDTVTDFPVYDGGV